MGVRWDTFNYGWRDTQYHRHLMRPIADHFLAFPARLAPAVLEGLRKSGLMHKVGLPHYILGFIDKDLREAGAIPHAIAGSEFLSTSTVYTHKVYAGFRAAGSAPASSTPFFAIERGCGPTTKCEMRWLYTNFKDRGGIGYLKNVSTPSVYHGLNTMEDILKVLTRGVLSDSGGTSATIAAG
mmetsp:Transcript_4645/g.12926  ORF Transcript_4645/g.12926 Transcript_4645/m.12926 type:complete len:182 (+) Transcript_4645:1-546(+)